MTQSIWKEHKEKKQEVSRDLERDSFLTHLKFLPPNNYFLAVTELLGKTNDAKKLQIHLKFGANCDYLIPIELDDEDQKGEKECMKNSIAEIITRMVKPPG